MVADFASGENNAVPTYFAQRSRQIKNHTEVRLDSWTAPQVTVYCIDSHALRLESLFHDLMENCNLFYARVVHCCLESMDQLARFPSMQEAYLIENCHLITNLDKIILNELRIPSACFDIGILNNDVVGYLSEYYRGDVPACLTKIRQSIRNGGLVVVIQPCMLYRIDNIEFMEQAGFAFVEGYDLEIRTDKTQSLNHESRPDDMSRHGHATSLIFRAD